MFTYFVFKGEGTNLQNYLISSSPSVNLNNQQQQLSEKCEELEDLKCHYHQLQQLFQAQEEELLQLKSSPSTKLIPGERRGDAAASSSRFNSVPQEEREVGDSTLHSQYLDEINFLQDRVEQLEQENFHLLQQHQQQQPQQQTNNINPASNKVITSSIDPDFESYTTNNIGLVTHLQQRVQELEEEVEQYRLNKDTHHHLEDNHHQHRSLDYSFETDHAVSKQRYLDLVDSLQNKDSIIGDLQEHISLLEEENYTLNSNHRVESSVDNEMSDTKTSITAKLGLRLPSPDLAVARKEFAFNKKRNSLPPLPSKSSNTETTPLPSNVTMKDKKELRTVSGNRCNNPLLFRVDYKLSFSYLYIYIHGLVGT